MAPSSCSPAVAPLRSRRRVVGVCAVPAQMWPGPRVGASHQTDRAEQPAQLHAHILRGAVPRARDGQLRRTRRSYAVRCAADPVGAHLHGRFGP